MVVGPPNQSNMVDMVLTMLLMVIQGKKNNFRGGGPFLLRGVVFCYGHILTSV